MSSGTIRDVGIVGAGPAGIAAAVQLARHGVVPMVVERAEPGGLLRTARWLENLPGYPGGISGPDLARLLAEQLRSSGAEVVHREVVSLRREDGLLVCETDAETLLFKAAIVASGTRPRAVADMEISSDAARRVYREVGELWGVEGKHIAIVGGGDAAFDYALGLFEKNDVTVLIRGERTRCLPFLEERARSSDRVTLRTQTKISNVSVGEGGKLRLAAQADELDGTREELRADYLVLAIGREPNDGFLSQDIRLSESKLRAHGELLFAGDVRSGIFRQVSIAAGQGTQAAMKVACMLLARTEMAASSGGNGGAARSGGTRRNGGVR